MSRGVRPSLTVSRNTGPGRNVSCGHQELSATYGIMGHVLFDMYNVFYDMSCETSGDVYHASCNMCYEMYVI